MVCQFNEIHAKYKVSNCVRLKNKVLSATTGHDLEQILNLFLYHLEFKILFLKTVSCESLCDLVLIKEFFCYFRFKMKVILIIILTQSILYFNQPVVNSQQVPNDLLRTDFSKANITNAFSSDNEPELKRNKKRDYKNRTVKKIKPIVYDGYSLDINIDIFKSTV